VILAGCIVVAILIAEMWPGEREPEYGGKKLSEWLFQYQAYHRSPDSIERREASDAVHHIGTNAIPSLLKWIAYEQPRWKENLRTQYRKWPKPFVNKSIDLWFIKKRRLAGDAVLGFGILGPEADPAVPELTRLTKSANPSLSRDTMMALGFIGEAGLSAIESALTNRSAPIDLRRNAISDILLAGTNAHRALPALVEALEDPDFIVRDEATNALLLIEVLEKGGAQTNGDFRQEN
jgi:hypothetical protein